MIVACLCLARKCSRYPRHPSSDGVGGSSWHGRPSRSCPVRWTNARFEAVLDTLKAAVERRPYVGEVISARTIGESSFVSQDRRTTFLIAALTPESTHD